ncbi:hypothetical protein EV702DRAFT_971825 [Suillus placidus]|uniref:Uncharacterized protein n=1 Tax=Suillus placidus TaxID=48579 RepID=A0A9P7D213_9AGAM|nr:hypothetical protein EV702DRAFT_971825 [Suillus placidus]
MLSYAVGHREAIDAVTQWRDLGLQKFELEDHEWVILEQLHDVLKDATLCFSRTTPNLAMVFPAMDHVDRMLVSYSYNKKYLPSIRSAVWLANNTLNHYYQLTDRSQTCRISMVLHLQHKLAYFKAAQWEDGWIKTTEQVVHKEFEDLYSSINNNSDTGCEDDVFESNNDV